MQSARHCCRTIPAFCTLHFSLLILHSGTAVRAGATFQFHDVSTAKRVRPLYTPPTMTHYIERLHSAIRRTKTAALVGLDPRFDQLPPNVIAAAKQRASSERAIQATAFEEFCCRIIDVVAPLVPAVKPQAAFFEELGPDGCIALANVMRHARRAGLIVICDAKRGDIGSTAEAYARGYLAGADPDAAAWGADALTVNPYLGRDTLEPFVKVAAERGAGLYVLVRTSNPGAGTLQDRVTDGTPIYRHVARIVEELSLATLCRSGVAGMTSAVSARWSVRRIRQSWPSCVK